MPGKTNLDIAPSTMLSDLISGHMEEKNLSIRGLAEKIRVTYEHTRRIVRGESVPSPLALMAICQELDINYKEAEKLSVAAKIQATYGNIPAEISGKNPELEPIERVWGRLTSQQKRDAINMILGWARANKAAGA